VSEGVIAASILLVVALVLAPLIMVAGPIAGFLVASGLWH
jgi:hypothetical protein